MTTTLRWSLHNVTSLGWTTDGPQQRRLRARETEHPKNETQTDQTTNRHGRPGLGNKTIVVREGILAAARPHTLPSPRPASWARQNEVRVLLIGCFSFLDF